jgi:hypothetical protein
MNDAEAAKKLLYAIARIEQRLDDMDLRKGIRYLAKRLREMQFLGSYTVDAWACG